MIVSDRARREVVEMKCLRNVDIRTQCELGDIIEIKVEKNILRWFGHVERMSDERLVKKLYKSTMDDEKGRGKPRKRWKDCEKEYVEKRGVNWAGVEERANDMIEWREIWMGSRVAE